MARQYTELVGSGLRYLMAWVLECERSRLFRTLPNARQWPATEQGYWASRRSFVHVLSSVVIIGIAILGAACQACAISSRSNPDVNYSINPDVTYSLNPDVTYAINPDVIYSINPNVTYRLNPMVTYSINPDVKTALNPNLGRWSGFVVCTPDGKDIGASVVANEDVMIFYAGTNWIGHFVTNNRSGFNFFNRDNEWKGFLVKTEDGGFAFFNREKEWVLSLVP
jgi:hypothetical protein